LRSAPPPHEPHFRQSASDLSTDARKPMSVARGGPPHRRTLSRCLWPCRGTINFMMHHWSAPERLSPSGRERVPFSQPLATVLNSCSVVFTFHSYPQPLQRHFVSVASPRPSSPGTFRLLLNW